MTPSERENTTPVVIARCIGCGHESEIGPWQIMAGQHPMCPKCYMPMVAKEARGRPAPPTTEQAE